MVLYEYEYDMGLFSISALLCAEAAWNQNVTLLEETKNIHKQKQESVQSKGVLIKFQDQQYNL